MGIWWYYWTCKYFLTGQKNIVCFGWDFFFCLFACSTVWFCFRLWGFLGAFFGFIFFLLFCRVLFWHLHKCMFLTSRVFSHDTFFSLLFCFVVCLGFFYPRESRVTVACLFWGLAWCQNVEHWFVFASL